MQGTGPSILHKLSLNPNVPSSGKRLGHEAQSGLITCPKSHSEEDRAFSGQCWLCSEGLMEAHVSARPHSSASGPGQQRGVQGCVTGTRPESPSWLPPSCNGVQQAQLEEGGCSHPLSDPQLSHPQKVKSVSHSVISGCL